MLFGNGWDLGKKVSIDELGIDLGLGSCFKFGRGVTVWGF